MGATVELNSIAAKRAESLAKSLEGKNLKHRFIRKAAKKIALDTNTKFEDIMNALSQPSIKK